MKTRISKFLSQMGVMSRRVAEQAITDGRIKLNGELVTTPVAFVEPTDKILIDGRPITNAPPKSPSLAKGSAKRGVVVVRVSKANTLLIGKPNS